MKVKLFFFLIAAYTAIFINASEFVLITTLYHEENTMRKNEYLQCLTKNLEHPFIKSIHIFFDESISRNNQKNATLLNVLKELPVTLHIINERVSFGTLFQFANNNLVGEKVIIANGDIYFNNTLLELVNFPLENTFIALSRWNLSHSGSLSLFKRKRSQDTWIFKSPIPKFEKDNYKLGTPGCDNYIAYQAQQAGMHVINPSETIQTCHVHSSNIRRYPKIKLYDPSIGIAITKLKNHMMN